VFIWASIVARSSSNNSPLPLSSSCISLESSKSTSRKQQLTKVNVKAASPTIASVTYAQNQSVPALLDEDDSSLRVEPPLVWLPGIIIEGVDEFIGQIAVELLVVDDCDGINIGLVVGVELS